MLMTSTVPTLTLTDKHKAVKDFQRIPGVGRQIAEDLWDLGYQAVADLHDEDPQAMYDALCVRMRMKVDRCMLYVFRCAVYFASHTEHDPELLKWWKWKDAPQTA